MVCGGIVPGGRPARPTAAKSDHPERRVGLRIGEPLLQSLEATSQHVGFCGVQISREALQSGTIRGIQVHLNGFRDAPELVMRVLHDLMIPALRAEVNRRYDQSLGSSVGGSKLRLQLLDPVRYHYDLRWLAGQHIDEIEVAPIRAHRVSAVP